MVEPVSNAPEYSVSELSGALKRTLEDQFGHVRLRGEISGYRGPHSSGHCYFGIKDQNAKIEAVIWKGVFSRLRFRPEEGLEVIATGRITTFPGKSTYQIVVEALEPAGIGALMALLEERRRKFEAEGLFAPQRKRKLPYLPEVIGIVTSPTGAVIRDMIHRLSDRFPRQVLVWPVRVQGEGSAAEVAAGIRGFNAIGPEDDLPRPDVLIVARGGGSLEDLWSFNEEIVIRAAAESAIPLVSAIGHETDWTLLDHVADIRAPTPTAAAEMVVPVRLELLAQLRDRAGRLAGGVARLQERRRRDFVTLARALPAPERALEAPRQRVDRAGERALAAIRRRVSDQALALARLERRLAAQTPAARLARARERFTGLSARLPGLLARRLERARERQAVLAARLATALRQRLVLEGRDLERRATRLDALAARFAQAFATLRARKAERLATRGQLLESLGYKRVLARGYAVIRDEGEGILGAAKAVKPGAALSIEFADGRVAARAEGGGMVPPRGGKARPGPGSQGSLF